MTKDEQQAFLRALVHAPENALLPCVSIFQREDGKVLTQDCPVGLRARRKRALLASTLGLGAVALAAVTALAFLHPQPARAAAYPEPVAAVEEAAPPPVYAAVPALQTQDAAPGFVTIDGPAGTVVFEGATPLGMVPVSTRAAAGIHTYRAVLNGKEDVFTLNVASNGGAVHTASFPIPTTANTAHPETKPGWRGTRTAGRMVAWPKNRVDL